MVKDTFIKLIQNPELVTNSELEGLDEVLRSFPYCGAAVQLSAKGINDKGGMFSSQKIKMAAMYANDRGVLKQLIEKKTLINSPVPTDKVQSQTSADHHSLRQIEVKTFADQVLERIAELQLIKNQSLSAPTVALVDSPITEIADLHQEPTEVEQTVVAPIDIVEVALPLKFYVHKSEFGKEVRNASHDLIAEYLEYRKIVQIEAIGLDEQISIIDKFINSSGGHIKPIKSSVTVPNFDLSKKSTILDTELVTENMANIFLKQQKFKKAIEVYEKLSLKYPEKGIYFAEKITYIQSISF